MDFSSQRLLNLARAMTVEAADAFLVTSPINLTYLLGAAVGPGHLVAVGKKAVLFTTRGGRAFEALSSAVEVRKVEGEDKVVDALSKFITQAGVKVLGVEANHLTVGQNLRLAEALPKTQLLPVNALVERLRAAKDPGEVEAVRAVSHVLDRAWMMFAVMLRETDTEMTLIESAQDFVQRAGGHAIPELTRISTGVSTSGTDDDAPRETVADVSKLVFDVTAHDLYHSRLVRSLKTPFPVAPSRKNKMERVQYNYDKVFEAVCAAHDAIAAQLREGITIGELYNVGKDVLTKAGFADGYAPTFGHGIGLEPMEAPTLREGSKEQLQSGALLHVAPQVLYPGWGGVSVSEEYYVSGSRAIKVGKASRRPLTPAG
jgi:Xaa-Pro aminopeptidase